MDWEQRGDMIPYDERQGEVAGKLGWLKAAQSGNAHP